MFCPNCAAQNLDGASFCRVCGANISLVPQALSGQLPQTTENGDTACVLPLRRQRGKQPTIDSAVRNAFMGFAFLIVAIAISFSIGRGWWFWMLIPAFSMMGTGVAQYIRMKEVQKRMFPPGGMPQPAIQRTTRAGAFPTRNTGELVPPPPSVTEGTTRHLGTEAATRHLDASTEIPK